MKVDKTYLYKIDNKEYPVNVTYKRIKKIHYRFKDGAFVITCHRLTPFLAIKSGLDEYGKKLIERNAKTQAETDEYIYILGEKKELYYPQVITMIDGQDIAFDNKEQLKKKLRKWFLNYLKDRTDYYADIMNTPHYQIKIRDMISRYGVNNKNKRTITYALVLVHYAPEIIDSVIIHELTHYFVYDHSDNFYRLLYKYSPNYDMLRKKLIKAEFN